MHDAYTQVRWDGSRRIDRHRCITKWGWVVHHTHSPSAHCRWLCKAEAAAMPLRCCESTNGIDTRPPPAVAAAPARLMFPADSPRRCWNQQLRNWVTSSEPPHVHIDQLTETSDVHTIPTISHLEASERQAVGFLGNWCCTCKMTNEINLLPFKITTYVFQHEIGRGIAVNPAADLEFYDLRSVLTLPLIYVCTCRMTNSKLI